MINLHPATPNGPAGTWQEVIWKLIEERKDKTGVMMHLVTEELDKGPPISYCTFPIKGDPFDRLWKGMEERLKSQSLEEVIKEDGETNSLFNAIRQQGVIREPLLIIYTLKGITEGKIRIKDKKVVDERGSYINGLCLNREIESYLNNFKG
jgi:phosphoribosylglycinamide formyltransferase-1